MTGRSLYEFNASTMTGRCRTRELRPADLLQISPTDAESADVHDGDRVRIVSHYGSTTLPAQVSPALREGVLFATFHTAKAFLNNVTGNHVDRTVGTPEYKVTAVRLEKVCGR
jgi:formate dehydrogenase major subunit